MRIISVSNRLPDGPGEYKGGLAVGVMQAMQNTGGLWIGWNGEVGVPSTRWSDGRVEFLPMVLDRADYDLYYNGFCNSTLYPLCHEMTDFYHYDAEEQQRWADVQSKFADAVADVASPDDIIAVHDVQVMGVGRELRQRGIENPIVYFQHIPYPSARMRRLCPMSLDHELRFYDAVGFHSHEDLEEYAGDNGHVVPLGIDVVPATDYRRDGARYPKRILGVDRLDYSKGILQRLDAFDRAKRRHIDLSLRQISPPTRMDTPNYQAFSSRVLRRAQQLKRLHGGQFQFENRYVPHAEVMEAMACHGVLLSTPLRDGMGLTVHEYIAAQNPEDPGVPIVSRLSGASHYFEGALLVDPWDVGCIEQAIHRATSMGQQQRRECHEFNMGQVEKMNCRHWLERLLACAPRKLTL